MFYNATFVALMAAAFLMVTGCGTEIDSSATEPTQTQNNTGSEEPFESLCASTPDIDTYGPNLVRTGEQFKLTLVSAAPAPWDVGDNDWTLKLEDLDGNALNDALVRVTPYMPDHGHGVSPPNYSGTAQETDGFYEIQTFNLIMPGFWEMTVEVSAPGIVGEAIAFRICVEG